MTGLTLSQLIDQLLALREQDPSYGDLLVHLLDMEGDGDGLLTKVELDSFTEEQGLVVSLQSWPSSEATA